MRSFFNTPSQKTKCVESIKEISFSDCLACSGCITEEDREGFKINSDFLEIPDSFDSVIISPHVLISIYQNYTAFDYKIFENLFITFIKKKFHLKIIVNTSYFKNIYNTDKSISSECPAVVLYVERVFSTLLPLLSQNKTTQQIASEYIWKKINNPKILSIMQCYDKKNELGRDSTEITHFLGTKEFFEHIRTAFTDYCVKENCYKYDNVLEDWEKTYNFEKKEVCGVEKAINLFNQAKRKGIEEFIELRVCDGGCLKGPAQLENKIDKIGFKLEEPFFYFETSSRIFIKPKMRTFAVNW